MGLLKKMSGYETERIPNIPFRLMSFVFTVRDVLFPVGKRLDQFGIDEGFIVIDFGCGPGSYVEKASQLVGDEGRVYAVDVHPLAIKSIKERARRKNLENVAPILSTGYPVDIDSHSADVGRYLCLGYVPSYKRYPGLSQGTPPLAQAQWHTLHRKWSSTTE